MLSEDHFPHSWENARGTKMAMSFDSCCCRFLHIDYATLKTETLTDNKSDEQLLELAFEHCRRPTDGEIEI